MKEKLRALMQAQDLSLDGLFFLIQQRGYAISYGSLICYYHGRRNPDVPRAKALAATLGVSLDELTADVPMPCASDAA